MEQKGIAILGATGSIGTQTLEVIAEQADRFRVEVLTAGNNAALLIEQSKEFKPRKVVIGNENKYAEVKEALASFDIEVLAGNDALSEVVQDDRVDIVLTALVGYVGLKPTIAAIEAKKDIALANKETLVVAGEIIMQMAREHGVHIHPVDSEHSAIYQCLTGEEQNPIEKIILTASGGPFRGRTKDQLLGVTKEQALKHPNWDMGAKITIDSASLMNKGLEVIEAKWLFDLNADQIDVIVHPQSIIHSMVQFEDGSIKAQMGLPDMKLPIQYALGYPQRLKSSFERFDFTHYPSLTFEKPDTNTFRNLHLAFAALDKGGNMPCILNAANEIAVARFLRDEIDFLALAEVNEACMEKTSFIQNPSYEDYVATDEEARRIATELSL
ncbi:1-deoxy-D-xylulose-5-phosphate reductoisomerase [Sediminitomix flava]|uniref:1-deoxy-D-xylulose 5-phosphate reductoisomerase n=1 Tax=Sediminitomix flava TaxID=379075 RepID=A0A315Z7U8_SEDFL|nr:1-deoxy-D-xylulose-5-phosphate reductoisomerase [Sediminitomix flava]PWJ39270.1 1-deoxy-D-xylulose 5-phosphate reductoisomerase [Sediminitomix flava]